MPVSYDPTCTPLESKRKFAAGAPPSALSSPTPACQALPLLLLHACLLLPTPRGRAHSFLHLDSWTQATENEDVGHGSLSRRRRLARVARWERRRPVRPSLVTAPRAPLPPAVASASAPGADAAVTPPGPGEARGNGRRSPHPLEVEGRSRSLLPFPLRKKLSVS